MAESERKYTYRVEIDAAQAKQQAAELRRALEEMLGELTPAAQQRGGIAETLREAQKPAQDLSRALEETQRRVRDLRNEYERMSQTAAAAASRGTQRSRANFNTYVDEVRKSAGDDAADSARRMGRATNIGNLGAEFKNDESAHYLEAERDALRARQEAGQKMRFTAEEKRALADVEAQLAQAELEEVRTRRMLAERESAEIQQRANQIYQALADGTDDLSASNLDILQAADRLEKEVKGLAEEETQMLESAAKAHQRLQDLIQQQDAEMRRAAAKATGTIAQAGDTGGAVRTQQTAITVSQASAANAERFAVAMREAAEASERLERSRMSSNVRGYELSLERERQKIRADSEKATAIEIEDARKTTATVQAEQRRQTATVQAETQERIAAARVEADVTRNEARASAAARIEQEKRITAQTRAELKERERAARQATAATAATRRPFNVGGALGRLDMYAGMAAGGLGVFGAVQAGQALYDTARQGAVLQRQAATFSEFSRRMGVDAAAVVAAVRSASNATITEFDAMGLASQVLASKFAQSSADIAGDLGTVTAFARRASQIFVDEQGQAMGVQEIFARLVKFAREGNKELVDQFGLSNQLIAEAMGVTVDGLASAQGATLRWQGLVKVLNGELERLGPAAMTTAERFEQSAARVEDARQRIQMAMAGPVAGVAEGAAGLVEFGMTAMGGSGLDTVRRQVEESAEVYSRTEQGATAINAARDALRMYDAAMQTNSETTATYARELTDLLSLLVIQGTLLPGSVAAMDTLTRRLDLVAQGLDTYGVAMQVTTMEGVRQSETIFALVRTMAAYEAMYMQGGVTLEQYSEQMVALAARMREAADAGGYLNSQLADTYTMVGPLARGFERRSAGTPERQPFIDPEAGAFPLPEGQSAAQVRGLLAIDEWERLNDPLAAVKAQIEEIKRSTESLQMERLRVALVQPMADAQAVAEQLNAVMQSLGDDTTSAMQQSADAIQEQVTRLNLLDQAAQLVDQAMANGVSSAGEMANTLAYLAAEVAATNTVTDAQVAILQRLIGALAGAEAAALGFAGAQTQYQAAMAAKSAKYATYDGYNYGLLAPRFDNENREGTRQAMLDRANEERRAREEAARAWESAAKKTASEFERAAEQAAAAFESALRKVPGLFGTSSVTGEQMAGAAAGVPQEFADNYLRRLADEVAGNKDWEGIDIQDAARRAGIDGNLPEEQILAQFQAAWSDSSLFAGGRNIDLITEYGGLDAIRANLARQEAGASGQQALLDFLSAQGLGPAVVGAPGAPTATAATAGLPTAEAAPDYAAEAVAAIEQAFAADDITAQLQIVGENTIAAIHAGYRANAGRLDWAGPLVDAVAAKVLATLNDAFDEP
jgi:archaellum component FlaC